MQHVFFKPWVGDNFSEGGLWSKKILILGESHYQWNKNIPLTEDLTIQCIREQIDGGYTKAFWTNIVITLLNIRPSLEDKYRCWHSVAFYNYIQCSVGFGPRVRPTPEMWAKSQTAFSEVIDELQPDCIIVLVPVDLCFKRFAVLVDDSSLLDRREDSFIHRGLDHDTCLRVILPRELRSDYEGFLAFRVRLLLGVAFPGERYRSILV